MLYNLLFCEGVRDIVILSEILDNYIKNPRYKIYKRRRKFVRELRSGEAPCISIMQFGGFPFCATEPFHFSRDLWGELFDMKIGILNDGTPMSGISELETEIKSYKRKSVSGSIGAAIDYEIHESIHVLTLNIPDDEPVIFWNMTIPVSLEWQIMEEIKRNDPGYASFTSYRSLVDTIKKRTGMTEKDIIIHCIKGLEEEQWFTDLCALMASSIVC